MSIIKKSIAFIKNNAKKNFKTEDGYTDTTRKYLCRLQITKVKQLTSKQSKTRKN